MFLFYRSSHRIVVGTEMDPKNGRNFAVFILYEHRRKQNDSVLLTSCLKIFNSLSFEARFVLVFKRVENAKR